MTDGAYETSGAVHELLEVLAGLEARFTEGDRALTRRAVRPRGLQVDVLDPPGRARHPGLGRSGEPTLRRDRRSVQEVGRRQLRRVLRSTRRSIPRARTASGAFVVTRSTSRSPCTAVPDDGRYSERIVGSANDRTVDIADDGSFEIVLGSERPAGYDGAFIRLDDDAVVAITRDYLIDPAHDRRLEWHIESLDPPATVARNRRRPRRAASGPRRRGCGSSRPWCLVPLGEAEPRRPAVPGPGADVRLGRRRRRLRHGLPTSSLAARRS